MQNYASGQLIPVTSTLDATQIILTKKAIARRMKLIREASTEVALYYMEQVEHLRALLKNNEPKITKHENPHRSSRRPETSQAQ